MWTVQIGWKQFIFNTSGEAAKLVDAIEHATCINTLYDGINHRLVYHYDDCNIEMRQAQIKTREEIFDNIDLARAFVDAQVEAKAIRDADQARLDAQAAGRATYEPTVDGYDGTGGV